MKKTLLLCVALFAAIALLSGCDPKENKDDVLCTYLFKTSELKEYLGADRELEDLDYDILGLEKEVYILTSNPENLKKGNRAELIAAIDQIIAKYNNRIIYGKASLTCREGSELFEAKSWTMTSKYVNAD